LVYLVPHAFGPLDIFLQLTRTGRVKLFNKGRAPIVWPDTNSCRTISAIRQQVVDRAQSLADRKDPYTKFEG